VDAGSSLRGKNTRAVMHDPGVSQFDDPRGSEISLLHHCEQTIEAAVRAVIDAGSALETIRTRRLYRSTHTTFEAYCRERWGFSRSRASRLINCAGIAHLVPMGTTVPERQLRELLPLRDDEAALIEAWRDAQRVADQMGVTITVQVVRNAVQKRLARIARDQAPHGSASLVSLPANVRLDCCDIDELLVEPGSVRLIVADPPYAADALPLYSRLGAFAARALQPGGVLVAYTGCLTELEAANRLAESLTFVSSGAIVLDGASTDLFSIRLRAGVKPLLFFSRNQISTSRVWTNTINVRPADRSLHIWQQAEEHARILINQFTVPTDLVCDPFVGSGTTAVVAHELGRRFVGCDIDPKAILTAKRRLSALILEDGGAVAAG
jgi:16S rRNA G966 N2-methylase RsmD